MTINPSSLLLSAVALAIVGLVFSIKLMKLMPRLKELDRKYPGSLALRSWVPFSRSWKANVEPQDIEIFLRLRRMCLSTLLLVGILWVAGVYFA